jgi:hypothetical protein
MILSHDGLRDGKWSVGIATEDSEAIMTAVLYGFGLNLEN